MSSPLAVRLRPKKLQDLVGQEHIINEKSMLFHAIQKNKLFSMILWGPPGSGKTTLASIIAETTSSNFIAINAVSSGIAEVKKAVETARQIKNSLMPKETILFIDEIHRFNKAQQDYLLPFVENRDIVFIGATTENPSFEVIAPLLSRSKVFVLQPLKKEHIVKLLERALAQENDLKHITAIQPQFLDTIAEYSFGDARFALNTLENLSELARNQNREPDEDMLTEALQKKALLYDKNGEEHYNIISALHKSMRDSDPDASVYWTVRMLEAGEDPKYVVRRMIRFASEDIGIADNEALKLAIAAKEAVDFLGMPECGTALTQLAIYLAQAPKSNVCYTAYSKAQQDIAEYGPLPVPLHIRNAPTKLMKNLGYGNGYKYAHDYENAQVDQEHFPDKLKGRKYIEKENHE